MPAINDKKITYLNLGLNKQTQIIQEWRHKQILENTNLVKIKI